MTPEDVQNYIEALKKSVVGFATQIDSIATGVEKTKTVQTVITTKDQGDSKEQTARLNDDIGPGDVKFIDALYKKFQPLLEGLTPKSVSLANDAKDMEDVLAGDEVEKVTKVSIVSISDEALKMIKDLVPASTNEKSEGFLSTITGLLGGVGVAAAGGGMLAFLRALPAAIPGILTALGSIIGIAAALSLSIGIVVKTISYLKDDIKAIFPVVEQFAALFVKVAKDVIPVIGEAITNFVKTVWPPMINALGAFVSTVMPSVVAAISSLVSSPGFKFLVETWAEVLAGTFKTLSSVLTETMSTVKSVVTDVGTVLVSLFDNVRMIVTSVAGDIKDIFVAIADPIKEILTTGFEQLKDVTMIIVDGIGAAVSRVFDTIDNLAGKMQLFFERVPETIDKTLNSIAVFANKITLGKITDVAAELTALTLALGGLTAGGLINGLAEFFTKSPFDKIIEFQDDLDVDKLAALDNFAPALQKLLNIDASQLKGVSSILNELVEQSLQVSTTVEKIFSGEGIFFKSGGILELVDKLERAKQGAEDTISAVLIKTSESQKQIAELQLKEAITTNKLLSEIYKKMDAFAAFAASGSSASPKLAATNVDVTMPLQFTSTNTRQQIVTTGNSR